MICLGFVQWDGVNQMFVPAAADKAVQGRRYVGAVAEQLIGPAGKLILRDRMSPDPLPTDLKTPGYAGVQAEIEGSLQVDRLLVAKQDEQIHGGRLRFDNVDGGEDGVPLWMQRLRGPVLPGSGDLRIHIGDAKVGDSTAIDTRLTVGNFAANGKDEEVVFGVRGDNVVEIPTGVLDFDTTLRQAINLWTTFDGKHQHGIGVQKNTTYFRTHANFCFFQDGAHSDNEADAGGGVLQLKINNGGLFFGNFTQQMLNLWGLSTASAFRRIRYTRGRTPTSAGSARDRTATRRITRAAEHWRCCWMATVTCMSRASCWWVATRNLPERSPLIICA